MGHFRLLYLLFIATLPMWALPVFADYIETKSESVFRDRVVGRALSWPGGFSVHISAEGKISGEFPNGKVEGSWQWREGKFCRTIRIGGRIRPRECLTIELETDRVRFRRANGGYFLPYYIGPPVQTTP